MYKLAAAGVAGVAAIAAANTAAITVTAAAQQQNQNQNPAAAIVAAAVITAAYTSTTTIITAQQQQNNNPTIVSGKSHWESPLSNDIFRRALVPPPDTIRYYDSFSSVPIIFGKFSRNLSIFLGKRKKYLTS